MAQAQITLQTRAPSGLWLRLVAAVGDLKARREARRAVLRMIAEREDGLATGARV
jgi:hypothetical protein